MPLYIIEIVVLLLAVLALSALARNHLHTHQPAWALPLAQHRVRLLLLIALLMTAIVLSILVLHGRTRELDTAILLYLHAHASPSALGFFERVTLSGASHYLIPAISLCTVTLLIWGRRLEAVLLAASGVSGMLTTYLIKSMVARDRPALWDTALYWGSSFPSGHTLGTAACATAGVLCLRRLSPAAQPLGLILATSWIGLVGLSRLVLGVHWPTDVLAGICIGVAVALMVDLSLDLLSDRWSRRRAAISP